MYSGIGKSKTKEIQETLAEGRERGFLFLSLQEWWGTRWTLWVPLETLEERLTDAAMVAVEEAGLDITRGEAVRYAVVAVARYVREQWLPHMSHLKLGRAKHAWKYPHRYPAIPLEEAVMQIEERKARFEAGRKLGLVTRQAHAMQRKAHAEFLQEAGMAQWEIAETLGVDVSTIRRDLSQS